MNLKQKIKYCVATLLVIAIGVGIFFGIRWSIRTYKEYIEVRNMTVSIIQFINIEFPDQAKSYAAKMDELAKQTQ